MAINEERGMSHFLLQLIPFSLAQDDYFIDILLALPLPVYVSVTFVDGYNIGLIT